MAKQQFLEFTVNLSNQAQVAALQAAYPAGRRISPNAASALYSAPFQLHDALFSAPSLRSMWFGNSTKYPTNVEEFDLCSGGWFGICFLFGDKTHYVWVARYVFAIPATPEIDGVPIEATAIAQRRWIVGWQLPPDGENNNTGGGVTGRSVSREASRHPDGFGLALRDAVASYQSPAATLYGAAASRQAWERIYVRRRSAPTGPVSFWTTAGVAASSGAGFLVITPTGAVALYNGTGGFNTALMQTGPVLDLDRVYKLDLVYSYATGGGGAGAVFKLFINGEMAFSQGYAVTSGLGTQTDHLRSYVGNSGFTFGAGGSGLEIDIGEWICADWPTVDATGRFAGKDWNGGSKLQQVRGTGFGAGHGTANWTGDWRALLQNPAEGSDATLTSAVSAAVLVLDTDAVRTVDGQAGGLGIAALLVGLYNTQAGANDGSLGWSIAGGAPSLAVIDQTTSPQWNAVLYRPAGVVTPPAVTPLTLRYTKAATVNLTTLRSLQGVAEILGVFGDEDVMPSSVGVPATQKPRMGIHNSYYPTTIWARRGVAPQSPVVITGGTYVGNGPSGQDLAFRAPVNWFWGRRVASGVAPTHWWSSMLGSHLGVEQSVEGSIVAQAGVDPSFLGGGDDNTPEQRVLIRLAGSATHDNASGSSYQYIAVSDPGMRFMLNGAFEHAPALAAAVNALLNPAFTPLAAFLHPSDPVSATTGQHYYKGPGYATDFGQLLSTAGQVAGVATFQAGQVTSKPLLHISNVNTAYSAWRLADGNGGAGVVVQILSYVGDGTGARTIALTPVSNQRPMFALVLPHDNLAIARDPSNTGTTSYVASNGVANAATGIVGGGVDQLMVGSALNANGIVYDVFVIPCGTVAGNGGWSTNGECFPVEPDSPVDDWDPAPGDDPNPPAEPSDPFCPTPVVPAAG